MLTNLHLAKSNGIFAVVIRFIDSDFYLIFKIRAVKKGSPRFRAYMLASDSVSNLADMKKTIAILFIVLYVFNLAGYYAVFKALQYQVRVDVKTRIKASVSESELVLIIVRNDEEGTMHWLNESEFRYRGNMYDVVRHYSRGNAHYYVCINDKQEDQLFKNLDLYVATQCNTEGVPEKAANPFKSIIKEYVPQIRVLGPITFKVTRFGVTQGFNLISHTADVPTPPPRLA